MVVVAKSTIKDASFCTQVKELVKKNFYQQKQHPMMTFAEFVVPVYVVFWMWLLLFVFKDPRQLTDYSAQYVIPSYGLIVDTNGGTDEAMMTLAGSFTVNDYAPTLNFSDANAVAEHVYFTDAKRRLEPYVAGAIELIPATEEVDQITVNGYFNATLAVGGFLDHDATDGGRWEMALSKEIWRGLLYNGFYDMIQAGLQTLLTPPTYNVTQDDENVVEKNVPWPSVTFKPAPYVLLEDTDECQGGYCFIKFIVPLFYGMVFFVSVQSILMRIATEKESGTIELMCTSMKVSRLAYWLSWLFWKAIFCIGPCLTFIGACYAFGVLQYSDPTVLFVCFWIFSLTNIALALLIAAPFFKKGQMLGVGILFLLIYEAIYLLVHFTVIEKDGDQGVVTASFLFSPVAIGHLGWVIADLESYGVGLQWDNVFNHTQYIEAFWYMLPIDVVLYMLLTVYIDNIRSRPGGYPAPQESYFYFLKWTYWSKPSVQLGEVDRSAGVVVKKIKKSYQTELPQDECKNGGEKFLASIGMKKKTFHALKGTSLNSDGTEGDMDFTVKPGRMFALLGHNGSGKTTLINILTGKHRATNAGEEGVVATVAGLDCNDSLTVEARSDVIGVCPQNTVCFTELSLVENMWLTGRLRGMDDDELKEQIAELTVDLGFEPAALHRPVGRFSGGMQRRLQVALCVLGKPPVIFLDEPSTGIDPVNRKRMWAMLKRVKEECAILLTTHDMEEADCLGDDIGVMARGCMQAKGTSLELKQRWGLGYHLHITLGRKGDARGLTAQEVVDASKHVKSIVFRALGQHGGEYHEQDESRPETERVRLLTDVGTEVTFALPRCDVHKYAALFEELEAPAQQQYIDSYRVSQSTLEEVFLKLGEEDDEAKEKEELDGKGDPAEGSSAGCTGRESDKVVDEEVAVVLETEEKKMKVDLEKVLVDARTVRWTQQLKGLSQITFGNIKRDKMAQGLIMSNPLTMIIAFAILERYVIHKPKDPCMQPGDPCNVAQPMYPTIPSFSTEPWNGFDVSPSDQWFGAVTAATEFDASYFEMRDNKIYISDRGAEEFEIESWALTREVNEVQSETTLERSIVTNIDELRDAWASHNCDKDEDCERRGEGAKVDGECPEIQGCWLWQPKAQRSLHVLLESEQDTASYEFALKMATNADLPLALHYDQDAFDAAVGLDGAKVSLGVAMNATTGQPIIDAFLNIRSNSASAGDDSGLGFTERILGSRTPNAGVGAGALAMIYGVFTDTKPNVGLAAVPSSPAGLYFGHITTGGLVYLVVQSFALLSAVCGIDMVVSKCTGQKDLLLATGLSRKMYWMGSALCHMGIYFFVVLLAFIILVSFQVNMIAAATPLGFFILCLLFLIPMVAFGYFLSFFFPDVLAAQQWMTELLNVVIAMPWLIVTFGTDDGSAAGGLGNTSMENSAVQIPLMLLPPWSLYRGMAMLHGTPADYENVSDLFDPNKDFLLVMIMMIISGAVWMGLLYFAEVMAPRFMAWYEEKKLRNVDPSVWAQSDVIGDHSPGIEKQRMIVDPKVDFQNVKRAFYVPGGGDVKHMAAVNNVSFKVEEGVVFGLLGHNGAGKSTLLNIMWGKVPPSAGDIKINNKYSVITQLESARRCMGNCPQANILFNNLTCEEVLEAFCNLGGVPPDQIPVQVDHLLRSVDIIGKRNEVALKLSGGNQRRLSMAMAFTGQRPIVILDEPTTGLDPNTRRNCWQFIQKEKLRGRTMILTTHSMEEADALCSPIAIMVDGRLMCNGKPAELKTRYGDGYTIMLKTEDKIEDSEQKEVVKKLTAFVRGVNSNAKLLNSIGSLHTYKIPQGEDLKLSKMFDAIMKNLKELGITDWSVSEATMDTVFLHFGRHHKRDANH